MRIKFRVWEKKRKFMHTVGEHTVGELAWMQGGIKWYGPGVGQGWCHLNDEFWDKRKVLERPKNVDILMQYTGLKDRDGAEIYEGDIVRFKNMVRKSKGIIEFENGYFGIRYIAQKYEGGWNKAERDMGVCLLNRFDCDSNVEVIGNIYEGEN